MVHCVRGFAGRTHKMPIGKSSFVWTTVVLLLAGLAALVGIVGTSFWLVERADSYFTEVLQARDARTSAVALRNSLQEMETGQRGFLLTGDEKYLEPYDAAYGKVLPDFERLDAVLKPYPQATEVMQRMRGTIETKMAELDETVRLRREGRVQEAVAIVRTDRGKAAMDEMRQVLNAVIDAADRRTAEGVDDQRSNTTALRWATIIGGIAIIVVVGGAVWTTVNYTRELATARAELEVLNRGLEVRVNERTQELMRANEEIQRFAYIVTHDLRAPLVNIMGFTSELDTTMATIQAYVLADGKEMSENEVRDARLAASEDLPEAIGFIRSSTRKMDGLINAILKISREGRRPLKPETIDLAQMLEATAAAVHHQVAETGGEIVVDADVPPIVSDRLSLDQSFGNLIDNAVKYRHPDRPVKVTVRARREIAGRVRIDVIDNGRGIGNEDRDRVFDLFRRAGTQDQPGEGIGLAYVRTLVRNLGGEVTLASQPGVGTTFTVVIPADITTVNRSYAA